MTRIQLFNLRLFFLILFAFPCVYAYAQTPELKWINRVGGLGHQFATSSTIDKFKNSYTAIRYLDEVNYKNANQQEITYQATGYLASGIGKYKPDGSPIYFYNLDGLTARSSIIITKIEYDGNNSILVIGTITGSVNFSVSGTPVIVTVPASQQGIFLAKYDLDFNLQWVKKTNCNEFDSLNDLTIDKNKNIVLSGNFNSSSLDADFSSGQSFLTRTGRAQSAFIGKYSPDGDLVWARPFRESIINKLITDEAGNIYFTGNMGARLSLGSGIDLVANGTYQDILFGKYDPNGNILWANNMGGDDLYGNTSSVSPFDVGFDITLDDQNNILLTGRYAKTIDFDPSAAAFTFTSDEAQTFLAKYTNAGKFVWAKGFSSCTGGRNAGQVTAFDPVSKRIIVGGYFYTCANFGTATNGTSYQFTSRRSWYDTYIATFDYTGNLLNVATIASDDDDFLTDMRIVDSEVLLTVTFMAPPISTFQPAY